MTEDERNAAKALIRGRVWSETEVREAKMLLRRYEEALVEMEDQVIRLLS